MATAPPADRRTAVVELREVGKTFGKIAVAVERASLSADRGEFVTILGPSGCGKTTLLRMIAGFIAPSSGQILLNGRPVNDLAPHKRSIGMVFQRLALFPHMTAAQNVAYPLKMRRFDPAGIPQRVRDYLSLVKLDGLAERRPDELSGGQQQRVAIARALVFNPDVLLLDEPLSALDKKLREEMQLEFRRIQQELQVTTINVTHDQREALVMSDQVIVMNDGVIQQAEDPVTLYRAPRNRFVAGFIGLTSFIPVTVSDAGGGLTSVTGQTLRGRAGPEPLVPGSAADAALRAEQVRIFAPGARADLDTVLPGTVRQRIFEGDRVVYEVACPALADALVYAFDHDPLRHTVFEPGAAVEVGWNVTDLMIFPTRTEDKHEND